ncbi:hypothetical protein ARMGADRAFT_770558 [Armillaria gallica]|uniref:Uncharacterized protein n=1 Tax=Armillaria gallica TaxID=47427 RepID=A0A2H3CFG5_ARMGA|nr:hypothetical protein ARMGADRAFT_770558 [Armillaria gallica]
MIIWRPSFEICASRATGDIAGCTQRLFEEGWPRYRKGPSENRCAGHRPLENMLPEQCVSLRSTILQGPAIQAWRCELRGRAAQLAAGQSGRRGSYFTPGCRPNDLRTNHRSKVSLQLCKILSRRFEGEGVKKRDPKNIDDGGERF